MISCCCRPLSSPCKTLLSSTSHGFHGCPKTTGAKGSSWFKSSIKRRRSQSKAIGFRVMCGILPVDPWAPTINSESVASQLFAASLFPYLGFLYYITKSKTCPKLTLFGFYFLLAFVGATIPAGIYAKVHYGTSLSNVDWLHGAAESLLMLTNLFVVLGLRAALRKMKDNKENKCEVVSEIKEKQSSI